jgi:RimJ/RimL family protein N-acetyltransferase
LLGHDLGVSHPYWPLFDLRLSTRRLVLRPCTEDDAGALAAVKPPDVETDPSLPFLGVDEDLRRGTQVLQFHWRALGTWTLDHWRLTFAVFADDLLIGAQELEGHDLATRGVVETSSWLLQEVRGHGYGTEMRAAVLSLAFDQLGALVAETEAWHHNASSLGVSSRLGYEPNGETLELNHGSVERMVRMRLTRERWRLSAASYPVTVTGIEACRHLMNPRSS